MNSQEIQNKIQEWCYTKNFNAPYGILTGKHKNKKGKEYLSITFGRARTLDATVEIYNRNFMILRTNRDGSNVYKNINDLMMDLEKL
jgi:ribosome-associated translation inhibitor RaiA